ncbi:hypothetical protein Sjap_009077 [Stephania japonica]|uniref:glucan endo-1,3-beta-D-glucosidase n=1 Tax=Stephania japonica TaxID=461633 RepID=A0AAP0JS99_9MAGN
MVDEEIVRLELEVSAVNQTKRLTNINTHLSGSIRKIGLLLTCHVSAIRSFGSVRQLLVDHVIVYAFLFGDYDDDIDYAEISSKIGINYGQLGNNLPPPSQSIQLIQSLNAKRVKLYNTDPQILSNLSNTDLQVSLMLPNDLISNISSNQTLSDQWVQTHILPFHRNARIRYLLIGNEVLSYSATDRDKQTWYDLVPAMYRIKRSLNALQIPKIKLGTPLAMDVLESSFPPSNGTFRSDISETVLTPLLRFVNRTKSFFFLDVYPYFPWSEHSAQISLDYALFRGGKDGANLTYTDPGTNLTYTNLLDQMLDSVNFAMTRLGFPHVRILISETGWPSNGDIDQIGANIYNAATYNRNLVRKITAKPPLGTPARPGAVIPTFIFSLYNENMKPGPGTERNWGLLRPDGVRMYDVDLTGKMTEGEYAPLPAGENNEKYKGRIWCVVARARGMGEVEARAGALGDAVAYACGQGNGTCEALRPGGECYEPVLLERHASYAFNSYWVQLRETGATCFFNGLAEQTTEDPSHGSCKFPSVTL